MHILIAEDDKVNLLVASRLLDKLGHSSVGVPDGSKALEALERGHFDLLLLDVSMPVLDGLETAKAVRARNLGIPIVLLTAFSDPEMRAQAKAVGVDLFLDKPLDKESLRRVMDQVATDKAPDVSGLLNLQQQSDRLIDLDQVRRRFFDDLTLLREVYGMYMQDAPQRLRTVQESLAAGDSTAASRAAHSLKGISGSVGSTRLSEAAQVVEKAGRADDLAAAREAFPLLETLLEQTMIEIRDILSRLPA
ncbi:CheY-like receiver, AAA-type ATPase, and DNA-binding domain containing response regulator [Desulfocurvibacter africanus PCS]|uniref:CheY-like receiver, AAA-type ATPase, and DNA-binding domain containing response regulator n=1 Tax=Desulfocurvibacter africanus PCS TaxID=1262666 RepID=M5PP75_DESAF|nr:response regulator [Desulfocurvibacter africanus]EMG35769.1 CheY-like receiver, AAA-type ATPase, and DNA-binding domain containing response regulator [Desulfocurvibacter africanus PCS]